MKQFSTIQQIDTGVLYALELTSSISVLLLAFGLVASMVNVLTKGTLLPHPFEHVSFQGRYCIHKSKQSFCCDKRERIL